MNAIKMADISAVIATVLFTWGFIILQAPAGFVALVGIGISAMWAFNICRYILERTYPFCWLRGKE